MDLAEVRLPRTVSSVALARLIVTQGARMAGMSIDRLEDLRIAVGEATTHAVSGFHDDAPLMLSFGLQHGLFEVHLVDGDEFLFPSRRQHETVLRFGLGQPAARRSHKSFRFSAPRRRRLR